MTVRVDHSAPLHDSFCRCRACKPPLVGHSASYRDHLPPHYRAPLAIQRTEKLPGHVELGNGNRTFTRVPARSAGEAGR